MPQEAGCTTRYDSLSSLYGQLPGVAPGDRRLVGPTSGLRVTEVDRAGSGCKELVDSKGIVVSRFDKLLTGGQLVLPSGVVRADLGIKDGVIAGIDVPDDDASADEVVELDGAFVLPGG